MRNSFSREWPAATDLDLTVDLAFQGRIRPYMILKVEPRSGPGWGGSTQRQNVTELRFSLGSTVTLQPSCPQLCPSYRPRGGTELGYCWGKDFTSEAGYRLGVALERLLSVLSFPICTW